MNTGEGTTEDGAKVTGGVEAPSEIKKSTNSQTFIPIISSLKYSNTPNFVPALLAALAAWLGGVVVGGVVTLGDAWAVCEVFADLALAVHDAVGAAAVETGRVRDGADVAEQHRLALVAARLRTTCARSTHHSRASGAGAMEEGAWRRSRRQLPPIVLSDLLRSPTRSRKVPASIASIPVLKIWCCLFAVIRSSPQIRTINRCCCFDTIWAVWEMHISENRIFTAHEILRT